MCLIGYAGHIQVPQKCRIESIMCASTSEIYVSVYGRLI